MFTEGEKLVTVIRAIKDQATFQLHTPVGRLPTAPTVFQINLRLGFFHTRNNCSKTQRRVGLELGLGQSGDTTCSMSNNSI